MTIPTPPTRYPVDTRCERIVRAALNEFNRRGTVLAREGVIARRAGVSSATLRRLFPDREELFRAARQLSDGQPSPMRGVALAAPAA